MDSSFVNGDIPEVIPSVSRAGEYNFIIFGDKKVVVSKGYVTFVVTEFSQRDEAWTF